MDIDRILPLEYRSLSLQYLEAVINFDPLFALGLLI